MSPATTKGGRTTISKDLSSLFASAAALARQAEMSFLGGYFSPSGFVVALPAGARRFRLGLAPSPRRAAVTSRRDKCGLVVGAPAAGRVADMQRPARQSHPTLTAATAATAEIRNCLCPVTTQAIKPAFSGCSKTLSFPMACSSIWRTRSLEIPSPLPSCSRVFVSPESSKP